MNELLNIRVHEQEDNWICANGNELSPLEDILENDARGVQRSRVYDELYSLLKRVNDMRQDKENEKYMSQFDALVLAINESMLVVDATWESLNN